MPTMKPVTLEQAAGQLEALVDAALAGDDVVLIKEAGGVRLVPLVQKATDDSPATAWDEVLKDFVGKAEGLPADLATNHDRYLHGADPK